MKKRIKRMGCVIFWLLLWQLAAVFAKNDLLFAGPFATGKVLVYEALTLHFWQTVGMSLLRILAGFLLALLTGCLLGTLATLWKGFGELLFPFMLFCKAVPIASFAVLLLIWWGKAGLSVAVSFLVALPVVYVNFCEGMKSVDVKGKEMAAVFEMPFYSRLFYLYRPALAPFMESCLKTALSMGIKAGVAAEVIGITDLSIGGELYLSKIYLNTAGVFAWTAVVILLGFLLEKAVLFLWKGFCEFKPAPKSVRRQIKPDGAQTLSLNGIGKSYDGRAVLAGVNKDLAADNIYCLMAPSGRGKTTLLHILAGLRKPDEGSLSRIPKAAVVFQEDRLFEEETALRNVELVSRDKKAAEACLKELLPADALQKKVKELSGGMRRRVSLARALAADSEVLFLDEPFNGLDEENKNRAAEVIKRYRNGRLTIAVTHEAQDAERLCAEIWDMG